MIPRPKSFQETFARDSFAPANYVVKSVVAKTVGEFATSTDILRDARDVYAFFSEVLARVEWFDATAQECFIVATLNRKNRVLGLNFATVGTASSSLVHPREVLRTVLIQAGSAFVCAHNHPSGDPCPSAADIQVTRALREAAKAVDVDFLDHVICGQTDADPAKRGYYSFRDAGVL